VKFGTASAQGFYYLLDIETAEEVAELTRMALRSSRLTS
jgi:hypothetical protein